MTEQLEPPSGGNRAVALILALFACAALILVVRSTTADTGDATEPVAQQLEKVNLKKLPASSTHTRLKGAPQDKAAQEVPDGLVVHPTKMTALYDAPAGTAFGKVGPEQFGDTWLPVIDQSAGWYQVLLPSRPNSSTGWIQKRGVDEAHTRYVIRVHLASRTLELYENDVLTQTWPVAVGASETPTPTGRTFLLGQLVDDQQSFSPVILPLGAHSQTLDDYGGGTGTVAIHGWTDPSVFGQAISHGCIRVPDDALAALRTVPIGTPVLVDAA